MVTTTMSLIAKQSTSSVRYRESLRLLGALQALQEGQGGIVELLGEPGSGKSRLLAQLTTVAHARGVTVLDGRCYPSELDEPLHVFTRAVNGIMTADRLSALSREHAELLRAGLCARLGGRGTELSPLQLSQALHALLSQAADHGLLLVLDDFHWADPQSLALADHLARWTFQAPVLLVIAHRPRQAAPSLLSTLAQGAEQGRVDRIDLPPLDLDQAARLLGVRPDTAWLPSALHESNGQPLYLLAQEESATKGADPRTPLLTGRLAPLAAELAGLDPAERLVAESAAVLGGRFSRDELAAVSELPVDETCAVVNALIQLDVVRPLRCSGTLLGFRHPLLRRVLHDQADRCWRSQAHRRALTVLNRRAASASERAVHIELSTSSFTPEDLETLARAGQEAEQTAPYDAVRWLLTALHGLPASEQPTGRLLGLIPPLARALRAANYLTDDAGLQTQLTQNSALDPGEAYQAAVRLCVIVECLHGRFSEAAELVTAALAELRSAGADNDVLAQLTLYQGIVSSMRGDEHLPRIAAQALVLARSGGKRTTLAGAMALHALGELTAGRVPQALASYDAAVRQMDELSTTDVYYHSEYLALLGWCAMALGRPREAESFYERGTSVVRDCSHNAMLPVLLSGLAEVQLRQGRLASARRSAAEAAELAGYLGAQQLREVALAQEALCVTYADAPGSSRASALTEQAVQSLRRSVCRWHGAAVLSLSEALLLQGAPDRCVNLLLDLGGTDLAELEPMLRPRGFELLALASLSGGAGSAGSTSLWADRANGAAQALRLPHNRAYALVARGHLLSEQGDWDAAVTLYQEGERAFDGAQLRLHRLTTRIRAARAASNSSRPERAAELWASAQELAEQWDVLLLARLSPDAPLENSLGRGCHALLPGPIPSVTGLEVLTGREREVAREAGTGRRTREIAEALGLSPRTVEVHLSRIYRKLEIGSRAELARLMAVRISTDATT
ncbi:LuxR family transcriptional regulator [Streptomyces globisporus]|uniref:helix-turn-helix transcriptional regulator n=1 Tax=Streptomyces globisporus TaxID=1908 RepID=UPI0004CABC6A|nr:LuxR family transcriptional regulator [Streptomyces globisporus]